MPAHRGNSLSTTATWTQHLAAALNRGSRPTSSSIHGPWCASSGPPNPGFSTKSLVMEVQTHFTDVNFCFPVVFLPSVHASPWRMGACGGPAGHLPGFMRGWWTVCRSWRSIRHCLLLDDHTSLNMSCGARCTAALLLNVFLFGSLWLSVTASAKIFCEHDRRILGSGGLWIEIARVWLLL